MFQGLVYSTISALAFASMAILVKLGYAAGLDGAVMMQYRFTYAALMLVPILYFKDRSLLKISWSNLWKCAVIGLVIYGLQTTCFVRGLAYIPASTAALILYIYPVTVALMSAVLLKTKINRLTAVALTLIMFGSCLVFYDAFLKKAETIGLLYAIGAMVFFSIYLVVMQVVLKKLRPLTATLYIIIFAAVSFNLMGEPAAWLTQTPESLTIGMALGLFPGVIAVTFLFMSVEKIGSAYTSIFSSIEPVATLAAAALFLDEHVVLLQIGGVAFIILGITLPNIHALIVRKRVVSQPEGSPQG